MKRKRWVLLIVGLLIVAGFVTVYACNALIKKTAQGKLYADVHKIPFNKTGILLGTSKFLSGNRVNPYYQYRIDAALQLVREGKIKYLIISGDNSTVDYNEPQLMKDDLIRAGIDSTVIYLDYAGFRTFDSMVRLKEIFGQTSVTVISQPFHNERAVYLASKLGITAIGFNAKDVSAHSGWRVQAREKLARVKVFMDALTGKKPKYLGERIVIPD
jgi:SanA protein